MRSAAIVVGAALSLAWVGCASPNRPSTTGPQLAIQPPMPVQPLADTFPHKRPTFVVTNATRTGPDTRLTYRFDVATDGTFSTIVASGEVPEGPAQTAFALTQDLQSGVPYVWRARALDVAASVASEYSAPQAFTTVNPDDGRFPYVLHVRTASSCPSDFANRVGADVFTPPAVLDVSGDTLRLLGPNVNDSLNLQMTRTGNRLTGTVDGLFSVRPPGVWFFGFGAAAGSGPGRLAGRARLVGEATDSGTLSGTLAGYLAGGYHSEFHGCGPSDFTWTLTPR